MPNYYSPYSFYPVSYANQMGYSGMQMPQQPVMNQQNLSGQSAMRSMEWVEGEVGAKAFQQPAWLPANQPIPLWDSTDTVIWLKSWGPMGIPNPMQKLTYTMPPQQNQYLVSGASGNDAQEQSDMSHYVTKEEFNQMKNDLRDIVNSFNTANNNRVSGNQNGSNNQQNGNRGGAR